MKTYNWAILGPGSIANKVVKNFSAVRRANVLAVASRTPGKAKDFAERWGVERYYESYEELVNDKEVDIIYITTPNALHRDNTVLAMEHGKHVMTEKPFAISARVAREMIECAKVNNVFLMDGMWSRFFPAAKKLKELIASGEIGEVHNIYADFSYVYPYKPGHHLYDLKMGGGTLLDSGVYPIALASYIYGKTPLRSVGLCNKEHGVDTRSGVVMQFEGGGLAQFCCGSDTKSFWNAVIYGEKGYIFFPQYHAPKLIELKRYDNDDTERYEFDYDGDGYQYEIMEAMDCIDKGLNESPGMPLDETVKIIEVIDGLREQWGIEYPQQ